jgi:hypothetical protein
MREEIFIVIITAMVLGVPILGLTIRMVIKTLAEVFGWRRQLPPDSMSQERLMRLEDEVDLLRKSVARLEEAEEFRRALGPPTSETSSLAPAPDDS